MFQPKTTNTIYIAAAADVVWQALTSSAMTKQYFFGRAIEVEPRVGGEFVLRMDDGRVDTRGKVVAWDPPRKLAVTWHVEWVEEMRKLPECLVTYDVADLGTAVRLTMTEAHSWDVPDALLSGGRQGWPVILWSLKSLLETGKPLVVKLEPPKEMLEAVTRLS
jgi:uncharacterized protein YndB with AHSA1/START domain